MLQQFSIQMPGAPFSYVLKTFEMMSRNSGLFFLGLFRGMIVSTARSVHLDIFHDNEPYSMFGHDPMSY